MFAWLLKLLFLETDNCSIVWIALILYETCLDFVAVAENSSPLHHVN